MAHIVILLLFVWWRQRNKNGSLWVWMGGRMPADGFVLWVRFTCLYYGHMLLPFRVLTLNMNFLVIKV